MLKQLTLFISFLVFCMTCFSQNVDGHSDKKKDYYQMLHSDYNGIIVINGEAVNNHALKDNPYSIGDILAFTTHNKPTMEELTKYGTKAVHGIIYVTTKRNTDVAKSISPNFQGVVVVNGHKTAKELILNDVEFTKTVSEFRLVSKPSPTDIARYGKDSFNGIIFITTQADM